MNGFLINSSFFSKLWTNISIALSATINNFRAEFTGAAGSVSVNWGDGTSTSLTSGGSVFKTLGPSKAIDLSGNKNAVTSIVCGTSVPKIQGRIDLSTFPNLVSFTCNDNDITAVEGYNFNVNVQKIEFANNKVTGSIPSLSALTNLRDFRCQLNLLTGSIPDLSNNTELTFFSCRDNDLTGSIPNLDANTELVEFYAFGNLLTGSIPNLSNNTRLQVFTCKDNQLTGTIPSIGNLTQLRQFFVHQNQLTGSIPELVTSTALTNFSCRENQLTGSIPWLGNCINLTEFFCFNNSLSGFADLSPAAGSIPASLGRFEANNNSLTVEAVNKLLAAFVSANRTTGTRVLFLQGGTNAAPTGQGLVDKQTLINRGWNVITN